jgi:hypothetical protein
MSRDINAESSELFVLDFKDGILDKIFRGYINDSTSEKVDDVNEMTRAPRVELRKDLRRRRHPWRSTIESISSANR